MYRCAILSLACLATALFSVSSRAGSCGSMSRIDPVSVEYKSLSGSSELIGFEEFTNPSSPKRYYWEITVSGAVTGVYKSSGKDVTQRIVASGTFGRNPDGSRFSNASYTWSSGRAGGGTKGGTGELNNLTST